MQFRGLAGIWKKEIFLCLAKSALYALRPMIPRKLLTQTRIFLLLSLGFSLLSRQHAV
jgi:hypothetical protein